jgi:putative tricarboxylic transport membrane protein
MFEDIGNLLHGFSVVLQPFNLVLMVVGIILGVIVGVLPGLGGANGVAILLPLTFSMSPTSAIIMLSCIYWGALFGGAITSILFNIPGEPWSVATTFDGYPMAQQGRAGEALTAAFTSSFVGALFAVIMITWWRRWSRALHCGSARPRSSPFIFSPSAVSSASARSRRSRRWPR